MPPHTSDDLLDYLGPGAISSLLAAAVAAVGGLGFPILWQLRRVFEHARLDERGPADAAVILGRALTNDQPTPVFRARLDHGLELFRHGHVPRLIITGGLTGDSSRSEAAAGRAILLDAGLPPDVVVCEDRSRHTLENLFNLRRTLREHGWGRFLLVSDDLHLARAAAMARGLGLDFGCSPAAGAASRGFTRFQRAMREALLLHWYHSGVTYSRLIGSERNLSRVT